MKLLKDDLEILKCYIILYKITGALAVTRSGAQDSMPFAQEVAKLVETRGG